jgi:hypothetical protein
MREGAWGLREDARDVVDLEMAGFDCLDAAIGNAGAEG